MTLREVIQDIRLRGLVLGWVLAMTATLVLVLTEPPAAATSLVLGAVAAAMVLLVRRGTPATNETEGVERPQNAGKTKGVLLWPPEETRAEHPKAVRVLVVDDDPLVRRLVRDTLRLAHQNVVGEAATGREGVDMALRYHPDIVLMDFVMPEMDGIEATRVISESDPSIRVVILTGAGDDEVAVRSLRAGAAGYLSKDMELDALPKALEAVMADEAAIPRSVVGRLVQEMRSLPTGKAGRRPRHSALSDRELQILDLLASGISPDQIAQKLIVPPEVVRTHLKTLYGKLGVTSNDEARVTVDRMRMRHVGRAHARVR